MVRISASAADGAWWSGLAESQAPKIIARLPFVERPDHPAGLPVFVVSKPVEDAAAREVIRISNATAYGLSSGVCTNRLDYITRFINELEVGTVNVWEVPGYRIEMSPFGGIKDSGLGYKEGVVEAMKSFTNVKTYSLPWPG